MWCSGFHRSYFCSESFNSTGICHSFLSPSLFFARTNKVFFIPSVPILGANPLETLRPSLNTAGYSAADRMNPMPSRRKAEAFPAPLIVQDSTAHSAPCAPCAPCGMRWEGWVYLGLQKEFQKMLLKDIIQLGLIMFDTFQFSTSVSSLMVTADISSNPEGKLR